MGDAKQAIEVIATRVEEFPAVRAWRRIAPAFRLPERVEILRRVDKSLVCRLVGATPGGADLIAKRCFAQTGALEHELYASILPQLSINQLTYYGWAEERAGFAWLFLDDAGGVSFDRLDPGHRRLAARWLAALHVESAALHRARALPDRGPAHYYDHMLQARTMVVTHYDHPLLEDDGRRTLDRILVLLDHIESRWPEIEAWCARMPRALVHADFAARNVRVRPAPAPPSLVAFDWEVAGWGFPAVDLSDADLHEYGSAVRERWHELDHETLERLVYVGQLLRGGLAATNWCATQLETEWPINAIYDMEVYDKRMNEALRTMGWTA